MKTPPNRTRPTTEPAVYVERDMCYRGRPVLIAAFAVSVAALAGCSNGRALNREEARSEVRSAVSFAAEAQLFVQFVRGGKSTQAYAHGQSAYLQDAVRRSVSELEQAVPEASMQVAVAGCTTQLKQLERALSDIQEKANNDAALADAEERMAAIRRNLERVQSQL